MRNLESRLSVLERFTAPQKVPAILRSIVAPGALDALPVRAEFYGVTLERLAGEGVEAFERRATEAARGCAPAGTIPRLCMSAVS